MSSSGNEKPGPIAAGSRLRRRLPAVVALALMLAGGEAVAQNLLVNGGAETGDLTGWIDALGHGFDIDVNTVADGGFSFHAGGGGAEGPYDHEIYQDVDVSSMAADIDAGNATYLLHGMVRSNEASGIVDAAEVVIEFRDGLGAPIPPASLSSAVQPYNTWVAFEQALTPAPGTRAIRVRLLGNRTHGISTEAYFDALSLTASQGCTMPPPKMASWWSGDQETLDRSGANDGTLVNGATYGGGRFADAFLFDGVDDFFSLGDVLNPGTGSLTMSAWVKPDPSAPTTGEVVRKGVTINENPTRPGYGMRVRYDGTLSASVSDTSDDVVTTVTSTPVFPFDGRFHHVAAVIDRGAGELRIYLDGQLVGASDISAVGDITSAAYLTIGALDRAPFGPTASHFHGAIDEVQVATRALTPCEILDAALASETGICKGDRDLDGNPDGADNCPSDANVTQDDGDADGIGDACDCAPADPSLSEPPRETTGLRVERGQGEEIVSWDDVAECGSPGATFDLMRGYLDELPVGFGASETCLESGTAATSAADADLPAAGRGFYYLVRGRNGCAPGTYGFASDGSERVTATCP